MKTNVSYMRIIISLWCLSVALMNSSCNQSGTNQRKSDQTRLKVAINSGPEGDAIKILAKEYGKAKIEIIEQPYSSLREQLVNTMDDGQSQFDIIMIDDPWFPEFADKLAPLNNIPDSLISDIVPASLNLCKDPYGIGTLHALPFVGNTELLFYRTDILSKMGITDIPQQWDSLVKLFTKINSKPALNGTKVYPYAIRGRSGAPIVTDFLPIYWSLGGQLVNNNGQPTEESIDPKIFKRALRIYKTLKEVSPPGAANFDWSEMTAGFTNGQVIFEINWPAAISVIDSAIRTKTGKKGWDIAMPPGDANNTGTSMIGNWLLAIPQTSKNIKAAEEFIIWVMNNQARVASSGNPPTRISVFNSLASKNGLEYFNIIRKALESSTPRVRSKHWVEIEDAVSRAVSGYLADNLTEDQAADLVKTQVSKLFTKR